MKKQLALFLSRIFILFYRLRYGKRVEFGKNIIINHKLRIKGKGKLIIGDEVNLWAYEEKNRFYFYSSEARVELDKGSRINGLTCHSQSKIEIGENCLIGSAIMMDTDFHEFKDPEHVLYQNQMTKPIRLGKGVWLGGQCVILKGVEIGDKCVIGFRAVVTKSFESDVVIAGNPAKVVKRKAMSNV